MDTDTADHGREDPILFDAILTPHRSLSPRGFIILMSIIGVVSFAAGLAFFLAGAWPVVGFLGLDVLLIFFAFRVNYRSARSYEALRLTRAELQVRQVDARGRITESQFQPAWLQVLLEEGSRPANRLVLRSHGKSLAIGNFLTADERVDLGQALAEAVRDARRAEEPSA